MPRSFRSKLILTLLLFGLVPTATMTWVTFRATEQTDTIRLDLAVPADRFAVEVDDPAWHASPVALQRDHTRDLLLSRDRWNVVRVTTDDVFQRLRSTAAVTGSVGLILDGRPSRSTTR